MKSRSTPYAAAPSRDKGDQFVTLDKNEIDTYSRRRASPVKPRSYGNAALLGVNDDDDDSVDDTSMREATAYAAFLQEQADMKAQFSFHVEPRKSLRNKFIATMRRKRRMLECNENLRFRELYKPPEPIAVLLVMVVAAAVTLILTKSWPFNYT